MAMRELEEYPLDLWVLPAANKPCGSLRIRAYLWMAVLVKSNQPLNYLLSIKGRVL